MASTTNTLEAQPKRQIIKIGTRKSKLAMVQAEMIRSALLSHHPDSEFEIIGITTMGDNNQALPLHSFGAKSLWTLELETLLLDRNVDMIVHCLKGGIRT